LRKRGRKGIRKGGKGELERKGGEWENGDITHSSFATATGEGK